MFLISSFFQLESFAYFWVTSDICQGKICELKEWKFITKPSLMQWFWNFDTSFNNERKESKLFKKRENALNSLFDFSSLNLYSFLNFSLFSLFSLFFFSFYLFSHRNCFFDKSLLSTLHATSLTIPDFNSILISFIMQWH